MNQGIFTQSKNKERPGRQKASTVVYVSSKLTNHDWVTLIEEYMGVAAVISCHGNTKGQT